MAGFADDNGKESGGDEFLELFVGVAHERRRYPRASLCLPLRLTRIGDFSELIPVTLVTRNISSSGVYFLAPRDLEPGAIGQFKSVLPVSKNATFRLDGITAF